MLDQNSGLEILVINLDSEADRWKSCENQAHSFGLKLTRVPAITPSSLSHLSQDYVAEGVRAVWGSHMQCLRHLLNSNARHILIMEDDFKILNIEKLNSHLRDSRTLGYDLVQFGFLKPGFDTRIKIIIANVESSTFKFIGFLSKFPFSSLQNLQKRLRVVEARHLPRGFIAGDFQPGAHCYLISRELAKATLELNNPQFLSIDDFFTAFSQMRSFKFMRVRKSLVAQAPFAKWEGNRFLR